MSKKYQDDKELDTFCQLEEALKEEEKLNGGNEYVQTNLAFEFPDSFVNPDGSQTKPSSTPTLNERNDFHDTFVELQQHLADVRRREADLLREENWVKAEKRELEKERKKLETDKMIIAEQLQNVELKDVRDKYDQLLQTYQQEKEQWEKEKQGLKDRIAQLEKRSRPKVTFITPSFSNGNPNENQNSKDSDAEEEEKERRVSIITKPSPLTEQPNASPSAAPTTTSSSSQTIQSISPNSSSDSHDELQPAITRPPTLKQAPQQLVVPPQQSSPNTTPPASPRSRKKKSKADKIIIHDNYTLDFDYNPGPPFKEDQKKDGRKIVRYKDGSLGTVFRNGTRKIKRSNTTYIFYSNGDVGIEYEDGAVGYRYKETGAIELSMPDKSVIYLFKNGQKEKHYPNGETAIKFPNGVYKVIHPNGDTETHYPDGKVETLSKGKQTVTFENQ